MLTNFSDCQNTAKSSEYDEVPFIMRDRKPEATNNNFSPEIQIHLLIICVT